MGDAASEYLPSSPRRNRASQQSRGTGPPDRLPPNAPESEQCVLGALLLDPANVMPLCLAKFSSGHDVFYDLRHQTIYQTITELWEEQEAIDVITVMERMKCWGHLEQVGGFGYLSLLIEVVPSAANAPAWIDIVWDKYLLRKMIVTCTETVGRLYNYEGDVSSILAKAERDVLDVRRMRVDAPIRGTPVGEIQPPPDHDPTELIKHRFLNQGGSLIIPGPTGMGKSSFLMQHAGLSSNGLPMFDIEPARVLRSVMIQGENDDADLALMRDGICTGLGFNEDQRHQFFTNVFVYTSRGLTGKRFCEEELARLLDTHEPDIVYIDPLFSFIGCDVKDQAAVSEFLRIRLNPLLHDHHCCAILSHHTNKPVGGKDKPQWTTGEMAYLGSGSIELANWARAVLALRGTADTGIYELVAAKRGIQLGWRNGDNITPIYKKFIAHSKQQGVIYWRLADDDEVTEAESSAGRPSNCSMEEFLDTLTNGMDTSDWLRSFKQAGLGEKTTFHTMRRRAEREHYVAKNPATKGWSRLSAQPVISPHQEPHEPPQD